MHGRAAPDVGQVCYLRGSVGAYPRGCCYRCPEHPTSALLQVNDGDANNRIWQDVYHVPHQNLTLYVKFTTDAEGYFLISFKEK